MAKQLEDPLEPGGDDEPDGKGSGLAWLSLVALGTVYGDIGTSPLYALRECFRKSHGIPVTPENVLGVLSLILWSLIAVISVKYLLYILRANNQGEGGILALMALLHPDDDDIPAEDPAGSRTSVARRAMVVLGLFGATLLYADGSITPAISVLSAVEGLEVATPVFTPYVLPLAIGILVGLFAFQRRGTAGIGRVFGPIMLLWFGTLALLGLMAIVRRPDALDAVSPVHAVRFFTANGTTGFVVLASVFLVVTGGEALYADIGHFGTRPIRISWFGLVLPALTINYFGQGALLLARPELVSSPFYHLAPAGATYPLVALATAATVIASQAVISGAFSLTRQAIQLGYCPRMTIQHTSPERVGQVYLPGVNWALMLTTIALAIAFGRSTNLAGAYGVAVSTTMVITTILAGRVAVEHWGWPPWIATGLSLGFLAMDLAFLGANLTKLPAGGWFPIALASLLFLLMSTWKRGRDLVAGDLRAKRIPLESVLAELERNPPRRVPGAAVLLTAHTFGTPEALVQQLAHYQVLHERVVVLTLRSTRAPYVPARDRLQITALPLGFSRVVARYGFMQTPRVPSVLGLCQKQGLEIDPKSATFLLTRQFAIPTDRIGMSRWRSRIFALLARNARPASSFLHVPPGRAIEFGVEVEL